MRREKIVGILMLAPLVLCIIVGYVMAGILAYSLMGLMTLVKILFAIIGLVFLIHLAGLGLDRLFKTEEAENKPEGPSRTQTGKDDK